MHGERPRFSRTVIFCTAREVERKRERRREREREREKEREREREKKRERETIIQNVYLPASYARARQDCLRRLKKGRELILKNLTTIKTCKVTLLFELCFFFPNILK
jgi:hypothetical protein